MALFKESSLGLSKVYSQSTLPAHRVLYNIAVMRLNSNSSMERSRTRILDDENFDETDLKSLDTNRRKVTLDPGLLDDLLNFRYLIDN